jgi:spermidine synthase
MLAWEIVARAASPDGTELVLARHPSRDGGEWEVRAGGKTLMSTRMHASEESLASIAFARFGGEAPRSVLVGGLGLGFTLRAVLDAVPADARVVLAELSPAIVEWNCEHVGAFADHPLSDSRVELRVGDVRERIVEARGAYDVILLDVDNGPTAMVQEANDRLYGDDGVRACLAALRTYGVLAVWSAAPDDGYLRRLQRAGFAAQARIVRAHRGRGMQHVIFLGTKVPPAQVRASRR